MGRPKSPPLRPGFNEAINKWLRQIGTDGTLNTLSKLEDLAHISKNYLKRARRGEGIGPAFQDRICQIVGYKSFADSQEICKCESDEGIVWLAKDAYRFFKEGDPDFAGNLKRKVEEEEVKLSSELSRIEVFDYITWIDYRSGRYNEAKSRAIMMRDLSSKIGYDSGRAEAYLLIGLADTESKNYEAAAQSFESSVSLFRQSNDIENILNVVWNRGYEAQKAGDDRLAHLLYRHSSKLRSAFGDDDEDAYDIEQYAKLAVKYNEFEFAARLIGVADGIRQLYGVVLQAWEAGEYRECVVKICNHLGQESLNKLIMEGRKIPPKQAFAEAMTKFDNRFDRGNTRSTDDARVFLR